MGRKITLTESQFKNLINKISDDVINEQMEGESEDFTVHGTYTVSNSGGYEIMISDDGDAAKVRDAFGSENPKTSDWLPIEYIPNEETLDFDAVIDPEGFNIPLNQVMRASLNESEEEKYGEIKIKGDKIFAYEPSFKKDVIVAHINKEKKEIHPAHGYFMPHKYGKKCKKYADKLGYTFNNK